MAENDNTILIDVAFETGDLEARAARIRAEIGLLQSANKTLKKDIEDSTESSAESARQLALNTEAIKMDRAELKMLDQQIVNAEKSNAQYTRSVDDIRQEIDTARDNLANLTKEQELLTLALMAGGEGYEETKKQLEEVTIAIEEQGKQLATLEGEVAQAVVSNGVYSDSLIGMQAQLTALQNEYASLSAAERESAKGTELLEHISSLRTEVGNLESSMGDSRRNVGNYTGGIEEAFKNMGTTGGVNLKSLTSSVQSFGKVFVTYPLNVITAILTVIITVIKGVSDAFKKNDAAMTQLQAAFSAFEPILTLVSDAFQALAGILAKIVTAVANVATSIIGKLIPSYKQAADAAKELVYAQDELEESERKYTVNSAQRASDIARLRNEAQDKDKSLIERKKALEEAISLEREDLKEQKEIAAERLRIATAQAEREKDTSDETKNRLADLQAAVYTAEKNYEDGIRRLQSSLQSFNEAEKNATNAAIAQENERRRIAEENAQAEAEAYAREAEELNNRTAAAAIEAVQLRLNEVARGSEEEYQLRLQLFDMQRTKELQNTELLESERQNIEEKYRQQEEQARLTREAGQYTELLNNMRTYLDARQMAIEQGMQAELAAIDTSYKTREQIEAEAASIEMTARLTQAQEYLNLLNQLAEEERAILFPEEGGFEQELTNALMNIETLTGEVTQKTDDLASANKNAWKDSAKSIGGSASQIIGDIGLLTGESEKAAFAQQAITAVETTLANARAIADGIAEAMKMPYPANLAAMATTISAIAAQFSTVTSLINQGKQAFAGGGIVAGSSYKGDKVNASLNSGEMVLTQEQQARLFEMANNGNTSGGGGGIGGIDYELLTDSLSEAVAVQPAPVMDYKEFTSFQKRTALYVEKSNIRTK
ncbi:MAG: hypothetical protein LUG23_05870 [Oscillospiraceae bacterium]|nr:hypothetical protein [Oscillospiraceae bacterium]